MPRRVYPVSCNCGLETIPNIQPWNHERTCAVLLHWEVYEAARELEDDERRAERRQQLAEENSK
jgi:hypothetical protein